MDLDYFANLLTQYWYILLPLLLISGAGARKKESKARAWQVITRIIGLMVVVIIALGVFGLLIR
jgi:hypothetical protein